MRIAIIGAGLAGLACACELERLGYRAEIFEKRNRVGKMFRTVETMLQSFILDPYTEIFPHLKGELHLPVNPANHISSAVLYTRNREARLVGSFGYTTIRGDDERSLEQQLARHIQSPIHFNQEPDLNDLRSRYDLVFVATGSPKFSRELGGWQRDIGWSVRGANVEGDFDPGELQFIFNTRYCSTGYGMISPFDERHATVGIGVPECAEAQLEEYWQLFRREQGHRWSHEYDQYKLENYEFGRVSRRIVDNVVLIGNAGGFAEPLAITGQMSSLRSGVYAARKVLAGDDTFDRFARRWDRLYRGLWRIRRNVNAWTDDDMDRFAAIANLPGSYLLRFPFSLLVPGGKLVDLLPMADDPSPEPGLQ